MVLQCLADIGTPWQDLQSPFVFLDDAAAMQDPQQKLIAFHFSNRAEFAEADLSPFRGGFCGRAAENDEMSGKF